ncbi:MAG: hypothetical protein FWH03_00940 [Firmicutes bacterium]|nr:hypothetical protein [Bacillota bacterium]
MTLKEVDTYLKENGITGLAPFYLQDKPDRADMINFIHICDEDIPNDYDYVATQHLSDITLSAKFSRKAVGEGYFKALLNASGHLPAELTVERRLRHLIVEGYAGFALPDDSFYAYESDRTFPVQKIKLSYSFVR